MRRVLPETAPTVPAMTGPWLLISQAKQQYQEAAKLIANKKLYSGVSVKLNNRNWRSEREYDRAKVSYDMHQWKYEPLV